MPDTPSQLAGFARTVADVLGKTHQTVYSYATSLDGNDGAPTPAGDGVDGIPVANLSDSANGYVYTDCSGWLAYALDSVAPLHQAVAATARTQAKFNHGDFDEATSQGLARAFVLADLFQEADGSNGFRTVSSFADLRAGDVIAYALGAYADPANNTTASGDTGHTMILVGAPTLVTDPDGVSGQHGRSSDVVTVYAVPIVDSSRYRHFTTPQDDNRHYASTPDDVPSWLLADNSGYAGGTGTGTLWFGLDKNGNVVQWRFDGGDDWKPPVGSGEQILIGTARLTDTINLSDTVLDAGWLDVRVYPNASATVGGSSFAAHEVLTGTGNVWVTGGGTLVLGSGNSFVGTTEVDGGTTLELAAGDSLGDAGNTVNLDDGAVLRFDAAMTLGQDVWLQKSATVDLAGHLVQLTGSIQGDSGTVLTLLSSTAGGELRLSGSSDKGEIVVGSGTTLSFTGDGTLAHQVLLDAGAALHVHQSSTLPQLLVSGAATLELEDKATLTVSSGIANGAGSAGFGMLSVTGSGSVVVKDGHGNTEATLKAGSTLFVGTLAELGGQDLTAFKAGNLLDITDLLPTAPGGITAGTTARYDNMTGQLTVTRGSQSAVLRLASHLTDPVPDPAHPGTSTHLEFTVRTDGEGGSLIGTATAAGGQDSTALRATQARAGNGTNNGPDGTGVVVGIISDSFNTLGGATQDIANGYLPKNTTVLHESTGQHSDEGREMARIVHDIAPGASILFSQSEYDPQSSTAAGQGLANAIRALADNGAKVIVDDISVGDDQVYQSGGVVAQAVQYAYDKGVILLTSAGNQGNNFYEQPFTLTGTDQVPGVGQTFAYAFHAGNDTSAFLEEIDTSHTSKNSVPIVLAWDQPAQSLGYTLTLTVFKLENGVYIKAPNVSYRAADPLDPAVRLATINDNGDGGQYFLAVTGDVAASGTLKLIVSNQGNATPAHNPLISDPEAFQGSGALYGHAQDPLEIAVGAVEWDATPAYGWKPFVNETFSATGPGQYLLNADGSRPAVPVPLNKPDVSGVDGAPDDTDGTSNDFHGTSAAAPSVAGVVALMLSANSNLSAEQVRAALKASAIPMANKAAAGAGLVQADAAVALARVPVVTSVTATPDAAGTLGAGHTVMLTLTTSVALTVTAAADGSLPVLTLDDGGTATLDQAASGGTSLVFRTVVAAGQSSAGLTVTGLSAGNSVLANAAGVVLAADSLLAVPGAATGIPIGPGVPLPAVPSIGLVAGGGVVPGVITNGGVLSVAGRTTPGATVSVSANGVAGTMAGAAGDPSFRATVAPPLVQGVQQVALAVSASNAAGVVGNTATVGVDLMPGPVANVSTPNVGSFDLRQVLDRGYAFAFVDGTQAVQLTNGTLSVGTDTNQAVVQRLYQGLLLRSAEPAGLAGFAQAMARGTNVVDVAAAIMNSAEYARLPGTAGLDDAGFIRNAYAAFAGRAPGASELSGWVDALGNGVSRATAAATFATAPESKAHLAATTADLWAPDADGELVTQFYVSGLGRNPGMPEVSAWSAQIGAGMAPQQVAQVVAASAEFGRLHNGQSPEDFVSGLFNAGLGRAPDAGSLQGWASQLRAGATPAAVLLGIAASPEAYLHLSPTV